MPAAFDVVDVFTDHPPVFHPECLFPQELVGVVQAVENESVPSADILAYQGRTNSRTDALVGQPFLVFVAEMMGSAWIPNHHLGKPYRCMRGWIAVSDETQSTSGAATH